MRFQTRYFAVLSLVQCLLLSADVYAAEPGILNLQQEKRNPTTSESVAAQTGIYQSKSAQDIVVKHANTEFTQSIGSVEGDAAVGSDEDEQLKLLADLRVHSAEELESVLSRVDRLFLSGSISHQDNPVVFLLHGEEARVLYQSNYAQHKRVVDLAAKLSAFDIVDIRVCEMWAKGKGLDNNNLQPFVDTVRNAPAEEKRLSADHGYQYF